MTKEETIRYLVEASAAQIPAVETARVLGVSRQRVYQLLQRHKIDTPHHRRKGNVRNMSDKELWLWRTLGSKQALKVHRKILMKTLKLPDVCPVLGIKLTYQGGGNGKDRSENIASLDQILPGQGYVPGNVIVVSWRANRIKNDGTPEEHLMIYEYYSALACEVSGDVV